MYIFYMTYSFKKSIYYLAFVVGFITLFFPSLVDASSIQAGMVIKGDGEHKHIYYVATDGKRYHFTDPETYYTWYESFASVVTVPYKELRAMEYGTAVTARPGKRLIQFENDSRIYTLSSGAVLRWVKKASIVEEIYGYNWNHQVTRIPVTTAKHYTIGEPIKSAAEYNAFHEREKNLSPNAELAHRGFLATHKTNKSGTLEPVATVTSLSEDIDKGLSPRFNQYHYTYKINADKEEDIITIKPTVNIHTKALYINGVPTVPGDAIRVEINDDVHNITVVAINENGKETKYNINIYRKTYDGSPHLKSITEDTSYKLQPAFDRYKSNYTLSALASESILRLKLTSVSNKSKITVNGVKVRSGNTISLNLKKGENVFKIYVTNGSRKLKYEIVVNRKLGDLHTLAELKTLTTEIGIGQDFDPDIRTYYRNVGAWRKEITITAKPRYGGTRVFIEGRETTKRTVKIYEGTTTVPVKVISKEGRSVTYRLNFVKATE